tara:strand:+ start:1735 stop:2406 length:672 start_codon:yes stop_codon:yes gene_type:complete
LLKHATKSYTNTLAQILKKRILIISIFSLVFLACSNSKIDGTWVLCYTDSPSKVAIFNEVFTFKNGHFESESVSGPAFYEKSSGLFELKKNQLILNDSIILSIGLISADSLMLVDETTSYTFKKLNDSLKKTETDKIIISGKKFEVDLDGHHFSNVNYLNGKISFDSQPFEESHEYYKRINHNGFDIIFQEFAAPKVIKKIYNDTILLYGFHEKIYEIKMWEE